MLHLDPTQVPRELRGSYAGKSFQAEACTVVTIPMTAGLWDGGSREDWYTIELATGNVGQHFFQNVAPGSARHDIPHRIHPGFAVVCHVHFCGKDMGLRFYVHPDNAAKLLPAPQGELSPADIFFLMATRSFKSSYGGKSRREMANDDYSCGKRLPGGMTQAEWDATKASLATRGLVNAAGAITVAGRNAIADIR
jgi:hypothetical protein